MEPNPSPLPWKVDGLLIVAADGTVVASVATLAPVSLKRLRANAEMIVDAVNSTAIPLANPLEAAP